MAQLVWHPVAIREAREAYQWFREEARSGIADQFQQALEAAVAAIQEAPDRWPLARPPSLRRKQLGRPFRYSILYRLDQDAVLILAVMHQKRRPGYWHGR